MTKQLTRVVEPQEAFAGPPSGYTVREGLLTGIPVQDRRYRLAGVSTAVLEGGDGPPVVLLHGPGEYAAKWSFIIPDLVTTHRVVAPDLPGHGESEPVGGPPEPDRLLAWVEDLIDCTCSQPPILVGHVLGGAIAARFASDRSDRLRRLVLVDSLGLAAFQPSPAFGEALTAFVTNPTEETHDGLWNLCAFDLTAMRRRMGQRWASVKAYNLDRARLPALGAAQRALMERYGIPPIPPADLARIDVPTTLIWGRHDLATPLSVAQDASSRYDWPLHVVEGAADDPPMEQPEAFLEALRIAIRD